MTARERRAGCPAEIHDTKYAYKKRSCACPAAAAAVRADRAATRSRRARGARRWGLWRDVDEVAVERAAQGEPLALGIAERQRAVELLTERGRSIQQISELLGVAHYTVTRCRRIMRDRQVAS